MEQIRYYTIDLTKIKGKGEFKCPKCGTKISPDDMTENIYTIIETVMKKNRLEKIILQCNKCKSIIHLAGFEFLKEIE